MPTSGPGGGPVDDLAYTPDGNLFALAGGVYRSRDGGVSWAPTLQPPGSVVGLAVDPAGRILAICQERPFRSHDHGATWDPLAAPGGTLGTLGFGAGGRIFAGTSAGLLRSDDDGASWVHLDVPPVPIGAILVTTSGTVYVGALRDVFRSYDGGTTWSRLASLPLDVYALAVRPEGGLYAGTFPSGVYRIDPSGTTSPSGLSGGRVTDFVVRPDGSVLAASAGACGDFVCWGGGVFRTTDGGAYWFGCGPDNCEVHALIAGDGDAVYAATGGLGSDIGYYSALGVQRSTGNCTSWTSRSGRLPHACVYALAAGGGLLWAAADRSLAWSYDGGGHWIPVTTTPPFTLREFAVSFDVEVRPSGVFAMPRGGPVYRSTNLGTSWTSSSPPTSGRAQGLEISAAGTLLVFDDAGSVWRSTSLGATWSPGSTGLPGQEILDLAVGSGHRLGACTWEGTFLSEDDGVSWLQIEAVGGESLAFGPDERTLYVVTGAGVRVLREANGWAPQPTPELNGGVSDLLVDLAGAVYAATGDGVSRLQPGDTAWRDMGGGGCWGFYMGFQPHLARDAAGFLYLSTPSCGVLRSASPAGLTSDSGEASSSRFFLGAFPNPCRSSTTIGFALPHAADVHLSVYDVRGRLVETLLAGARLGAGRHDMIWEPSARLAQGSYVYLLRAGTTARAGRVSVIR